MPSLLLLAFSALALALGGQRALIVAASDYRPSTGWSALHAHNDATLLRAGLQRRGFAEGDIRVLGGRRLAKDAVVLALRRWDVEEGDHLYVHFSGHGQRITDLSGDETDDGYDEALAFLDTPGLPRFAPARYRGEKHLIDDELGAELARLRAKVGASGSLAVVIDSCHSGTVTRGLPTRGSGDFDLEPSRRDLARRREGQGAGSGFADVLTEGEGLAPMVVLSASRSNQPAREIYGPDNQIVGALSSVLAEVFAEERGLDTWRAVYDKVVARLRRTVPGQVPQIEGAVDGRMFDGTHVDPPFYTTVLETRRGGQWLVLAAGRLLGISVDAELEVHRAGTTVPSEASLLGEGRVVQATSVQAVLELADRISGKEIEGARVFVKQLPRDDLRTTVALALEREEVGAAWAEDLDRLKLVAVTDEAPDFTLVQRQGTVYLVDSVPPEGAGPPPLPLLQVPVADRVPGDLLVRLSNLARSKLIDLVDLHDERFQVSVEVIPAKWKGGKPSAKGCAPAPGRASAGELRFAPGDVVILRVRLEGEPAHVSIVVTNGLGISEQIYPAVGESWDVAEQAGVVFEECVALRWEAHNRPGVPSVESLKVFASPEPAGIDFRGLLSASVATRSGAESALDLLWQTASQTRGLEISPGDLADGGSTAEVTYVLDPPVDGDSE